MELASFLCLIVDDLIGRARSEGRPVKNDRRLLNWLGHRVRDLARKSLYRLSQLLERCRRVVDGLDYRGIRCMRCCGVSHDDEGFEELLRLSRRGSVLFVALAGPTKRDNQLGGLFLGVKVCSYVVLRYCGCN